MVWTYIPERDVGKSVFKEQAMTEKVYRNVLEEGLFRSAKKRELSKRLVLMHDNDPKHCSRIVDESKSYDGTCRMSRILCCFLIIFMQIVKRIHSL